MSVTVKTFVAAGAAAMLSACSGHLSQAERTAPPTDAFAAKLQSGYVRLARAEMDENDFTDARVFADRALAAAASAPPAPESLGARKLPQESVPELADARERLVKALDAGARDSAADDAADAQLSFDCWMQEQEENFQDRDIAECRTNFFAALKRMEIRNLAKAEPEPETPMPQPTPAAIELPARVERTPLSTRFVVYFDFDRASLSGSSEAELARAADAARRTGAAMVRVTGHADRSGPASHNLSLSRSRAREVVAALRRLGLPEIGVATQAFGEERPQVRTPDGVREQRNRRVEIELTH